MEPKTEIQKETQKNEWWRVYEKLGGVLKEFVDWYVWRYNMPVEFELGADYVEIYTEYDIAQELEACEKACIEQAKKDMLSEEFTEDDIAQGCYDSCIEDIAMDTNACFSEIRRKLWEVLDKYGFKYDWEDSWEGDTKYLRFLIKF